MKKLFDLPTWQAFLLLFVPLLFPSNDFGLVLTILWTGFVGFCISFLGHSLYKKLPEPHDLNIQWFNFHLLFIIVYLTVVFVGFGGGYEINLTNYKDYGDLIFIIIPLHIFTMYCVFYVMRFIAKSIATIEHKKIVGFDTYAGNFFLLFFIYIGIWWIYPKIRTIFSVNAKPTSPAAL